MPDFEALKSKWQDSEWQQRASLAMEMGKLGLPEAEMFLCGILDREETYFVRGFAALSLSNAKRKETVQILSSKLNKNAIFQCDSSEFVRACCAQALGANAEGITRMGQETRETALFSLRKALEDEPSVVEKALPALGMLGDRQSLGKMYKATQEKLVTMEGKPDFCPLAIAMCAMGITEPHAVAVYTYVLEKSMDMEAVEKVLEKAENFLRDEPKIDVDGKFSSAIRVCRRKVEFSRLAKSKSESFVDSVIGRVGTPIYRESKVPPPIPNKR